MTWLDATRWGIPIVLVLLIAYDVIAYLRGGVKATISRVTLAWAKRWPLVPLAVGVLLGHLFWPQPDPGLCDCDCETPAVEATP